VSQRRPGVACCTLLHMRTTTCLLPWLHLPPPPPPNSIKFTREGLSDLFTNGLSDITELEYIPAGNARMADDGTITCQHGELVRWLRGWLAVPRFACPCPAFAYPLPVLPILAPLSPNRLPLNKPPKQNTLFTHPQPPPRSAR